MNRFVIAMIISMASSCATGAGIKGIDYKAITIDVASYEFVLPKPFGRSSITLMFQGDYVGDMKVTTESVNVTIDPRSLEELRIRGAPHVSVFGQHEAHETNHPVDEFSIGFEIGEKYEIVLSDVPNCAAPCIDNVIDTVLFKIDNHGVVRYQVFETGTLLGGDRSEN